MHVMSRFLAVALLVPAFGFAPLPGLRHDPIRQRSVVRALKSDRALKTDRSLKKDRTLKSDRVLKSERVLKLDKIMKLDRAPRSDRAQKSNNALRSVGNNLPSPPVVADTTEDEPAGLSPVLGALLSCTATFAFLTLVMLQSNSISDTFLTMGLAEKLSILSRISWFPAKVTEAQIVVSSVLGFAAFAQALTGFGFAIVAVGALSSMPWLLHSELYEVITPVAATLGALVGSIILLPVAQDLEWDEILPLCIPCAIFTPVGIYLSSLVDPVVATKGLAVLVLAFVAYQLFNGDNKPPKFLSSTPAAYLLGAAAGISGGAFDVQGPPLVVYGNAKEWEPRRFRDTILAVVALNSALVVVIDYFNGSLGNFYYSYFCITSIPGLLVGITVGQIVSEKIDPALFKKVVLGMCVFLGFQLLTLK
eukprot:CAMPEP_0194316690 /NCGR_PEP_ID=MMETSP0171-20130528/13480_1 /TAXON_ID=218684 /ORGANISM="Corethron pennatum, Strain L29A3" /LENGTH=419 /DNA_ID=CAMNT_0039073031 /DNA_START=326 /DNA_END=1585 /DNA_ORIENTATION=-